MALDLARLSFSHLGQLRTFSSPKRVRALVGANVVADTRSPLLVWEPRRVVPEYALPEADLIDLELTESAGQALPDPLPPFLPPGHFGWHTTPGSPLAVHHRAADLGEVAFRPADPDLRGYVLFSFAAFEWLEEDAPVVSHPHDPFSRIDILASDRTVQVRFGDQILATSHRPMALFETGLPTRWYLPREDVRMDLLTSSDTQSTCAYKGRASYLSSSRAPDGQGQDVAWYYPDPLQDAELVRDLIAFWPGRVEMTVDGVSETRGMPGE